MNINESKASASMTIGELLTPMSLENAVASIEIEGLSVNSREVTAGELFIALAGTQVNGEDYIDDAIKRGAAAVLVTAKDIRPTGVQITPSGIPLIAVADLKQKVSSLSGRFFGDPSERLCVAGVTGTNGKSSIVSLIAQLQELTGTASATIGTLGVAVNGETINDTGMTTPDAIDCQKWLAELCARKIRAVSIEVSSHGLDQARVAGIHFRTGVFTNISHDHLDYHGTVERYALSKQKLFRMKTLRNAIINLDDPFAIPIIEVARQSAQVISYSLKNPQADTFASDIQYGPNGVVFRLKTMWGSARVYSPLLGDFNVYNLIAAISAVCADKVSLASVLNQVPHLCPIPGRMEKITESQDIVVVVDYAHTPDALQHAIAAIRRHATGKLWVVFGCGGDRDTAKRPVMARIAEQFADKVVVTSDNPRTEDPQRIIEEICTGFDDSNFKVIHDRLSAITYAVNKADPGDVVLLAGKGHEKYQIVGDVKHPFDETTIVRDALAQRNGQASAGKGGQDAAE